MKAKRQIQDMFTSQLIVIHTDYNTSQDFFQEKSLNVCVTMCR